MKKFIQYFIGTLAAILVVAVSASAATTFTPKQGGTGLTTGPTKGDLLVGSSTVTYAKLGVGTNGKCLTASSTATYGISWETCSSSSGISSLNGISTSSISIQGTANQVNVASSTNLITLSLPQSIGTTSLVQLGKLGLGGVDNGRFLRVAGSVGLHSVDVVTTNLGFGLSGGATAATEPIGVYIAPVFQYPNGPTPTDIISSLYIDSTTLSGSGTSTVTSTASVYVAGPITGTSSQAYSLWVASGTSRLDGPALFGTTLNASGTISQSGTPVVLNTRAVNTGTGLTGGGNLSADRTVSLNINSGTTQNCSAAQFANSLTGVGIIGCGSPSGSLKLPTITVASSSADYSNLAAAVLAAANTTNYPDGALLYLPDSAYSVTTTLNLANGINIVGNPHQTTINFTATSTGSATSPGSVLFQASGTTPGNVGLSNLILNQSNGGYKGTALDMSNISLLKVNNIQSLGFKYGIYANDTANNTFYNNVTNWASFDDNCIYASSTNPFNDNTFINIRCGFNSGNNPATSTTYGLFLNNGQNNNFYNFNAEPAHSAGTIGVDLQTANALSNSFFGLYAEANATSVLIGTSAKNNNFFGGQVCCHTGTSISDSGTRTLFLGLNDNFTGLASSTIPAPIVSKDSSANSLTNLFQNNNSFAHINSNLVTMQLLNGSDTSGVLKLDNAGTGPSLVVRGGTVVATGTAATVSGCGTSPSIVGTSFAGKVTTGSNATSTCTVTFPVSFQVSPACTVSSQTTSSINYMAVTTTSTLKIQTANSSAFASNQLNYICIGF